MEFAFRFRFIALGALVIAGLGAGAWLVLRGNARPGPEPAAPLLGGDHIVVEVLNGSGKRGLARTATRALRQAGFDVVYFGTVPDSIATTQVLARRGDSLAAVRVARALGGARTALKTDTLLRVDVTVLLGGDYRPPPGLRP
ncbi:MAG TPA: LytR C-terminal domain-containing protein [Gemmatimonadales bacterium]|nr:LytR C-terminal domain-containing protein [Gemmatimonadales bacterium]